MAPSKQTTAGRPAARSPARRGRVFLRRQGNFYGEGEILYPEPFQPPQFLPRTEWPEDPSQGANHRPAGRYPNNYWPRDDSNIPAAQEAVRRSVELGYPQLKPMGPYQLANSPHSGRPIYEGSIWHDHVAILHGVLRHTLPNKRWLEGDDIAELLICLSYGMNQSTLCLRPWVIMGPSPANPNPRAQMPFQQSWNDAFGMEMKDGAYQTDAPQLDRAAFKNKMRHEMLGRRWLVAPINQVGHHWIISLFDREEGQLYIFDALSSSRDQRIEATIHLWARFWNDLDMPFHFQYYVPSVTIQSSSWECGLLCVYWVLMTLRNRVGTKMLASNVQIQTDDFALCGRTFSNEFPLADSSLHIPDWMPINCMSGKTALAAVVRDTQVLICNDLGLWNEPMFKQNDGKTTVSPFERLFQFFSGKKGKEKMPNFFTGHGGLQFSYSQQSTARDYNPSADREQRPASGTDGFVELRPQQLAAVPYQDIDRIRFPEPAVAEGHGLWARHLQPDDENFTDERYDVLLELGDRRDPNRTLAPLTITLDKWRHNPGANHFINYMFRMQASFPYQPEEQRPSTDNSLPVANRLQPLPQYRQLAPPSTEEETSASEELEDESATGEDHEEMDLDEDVNQEDLKREESEFNFPTDFTFPTHEAGPSGTQSGDRADESDDAGQSPRGAKRPREIEDNTDEQGSFTDSPSARPQKRPRRGGVA